VSILTRILPLVLSGVGALKGELSELQMVSEERDVYARLLRIKLFYEC